MGPAPKRRPTRAIVHWVKSWGSCQVPALLPSFCPGQTKNVWGADGAELADAGLSCRRQLEVHPKSSSDAAPDGPTEVQWHGTRWREPKHSRSRRSTRHFRPGEVHAAWQVAPGK
jgi:hypothetical protein